VVFEIVSLKGELPESLILEFENNNHLFSKPALLPVVESRGGAFGARIATQCLSAPFALQLKWVYYSKRLPP